MAQFHSLHVSTWLIVSLTPTLTRYIRPLHSSYLSYVVEPFSVFFGWRRLGTESGLVCPVLLDRVCRRVLEGGYVGGKEARCIVGRVGVGLRLVEDRGGGSLRTIIVFGCSRRMGWRFGLSVFGCLIRCCSYTTLSVSGEKFASRAEHEEGGNVD